jgi:PAS domain S-box-containing protein
MSSSATAPQPARAKGKKSARKQKAAGSADDFYPSRAETQSDFIVVYDTGGSILYVNPAMERTLGYAAEEMAGTPLLSYIAPEFHNTMAANMDACQKTNDPPFYETVLVAANGFRRQVIVKGRPVRYQGRDAGLFFLLDITERKALEDLIRQRADQLQAFSNALQVAGKKQRLLSSITRHDINNQLTGLKIYLGLIEQEQTDPALAVYCQKATAAADQIAAIIQFTREYEQIGIAAPVWHDCRQLADSVARQVMPEKIAFHNDLPHGMEVFADPLIFKVFYNLLDNAVRYGGKITAVQLYAHEAEDGSAVIVCEDNGDGVPENEKERIFDMGFGKNTGLGLALSREILDITGITVRETGTSGAGARFEMDVPPENCRFVE